MKVTKPDSISKMEIKGSAKHDINLIKWLVCDECEMSIDNCKSWQEAEFFKVDNHGFFSFKKYRNEKTGVWQAEWKCTAQEATRRDIKSIDKDYG